MLGTTLGRFGERYHENSPNLSTFVLVLLDHLDDGDAGLVGPDGGRLLLRVLVRPGALLRHVNLKEILKTAEVTV